MSAEQPSPGRPTGPPSGPLSGRSGPSGHGPPGERGGGPAGSGAGGPLGPGGTGGPPGPGGAGGSGDGGEGPGRRPWWRSVPLVAVVATAVVAAVILAVVLGRSGGGGAGSERGSASGAEVFLLPAGEAGPDPFTDSSATDSSAPPATPSTPDAPDTPSPSANVRLGISGSAPGLYGGTRDTGSCDVEKQIGELRKDPDKNRAFASVQGIRPSEVPAYLRSLTPVQLRYDTRVTSHGYRDGRAVPYQAVLQAGTAVLVDDRGVPRVRCVCGNPLLPPVAQRSAAEVKGVPWPSYRGQDVVVVSPAKEPLDAFVLYDPERKEWFERPQGDTGDEDRPADPPSKEEPSAPSGDGSGTTDSPGSGSPGSDAPESDSPRSGSPEDDPTSPSDPSSEPPSSEPQSSPPEEPRSEQPPPSDGTPGGGATDPPSAPAPEPSAPAPETAPPAPAS
ncbi:DUF6777 domain-containing protein [Streptomyces sp. NPDC085946]|uniref:DUF6777 domain-containing protein n=1 Tax=Streptomyces sp. NPDC085946 TaxID=3365744 RepID=UPI0037D69275